jgi:hypothetical protein
MSSPIPRGGCRAAATALVATALALITAPGAAAAAVFGGSTRAGEPIVLTADSRAKKLRSTVITWEAACDDGRLFPVAVELTAATAAAGFTPGPRDLMMSRNRQGKFAGEQVGALNLGSQIAGVAARLTGKLGARRASGTLEANVEITYAATGEAAGSCSTGAVRWSATRDPRRIYGGATSQEEPIVLRLDRRRRTVTDVLVGWQTSTCEPPENFIRFGERFGNFPLRSGRFGDAFADSVSAPDGTIDFGYELNGSVARSSARGRLHVTVTSTDATGMQTMACDSGGVSWSARTG